VAALQRIVQQDQASWPQPGQHLFVVLGVAGLVGVDEREVELLARWQCAQGFQARTDPQLDPVGDPGFLPRRAGNRGPLLADVTAQQMPAGTQASRHGQRRIAGERADLHRAGGSHGPDQHLHQHRLVIADLHNRGPAGLLLRGALQLKLVRVGRGGMRCCVLIDHRINELAPPASGR